MIAWEYWHAAQDWMKTGELHLPRPHFERFLDADRIVQRVAGPVQIPIIVDTYHKAVRELLGGGGS